MRQSITQSLPTDATGILNLQDTPQLTSAPSAQWSQGATAISHVLPGSPGLTQDWSVLAVSFQAYLGLNIGGHTSGLADEAAAIFGKLGRLFVAFDPNSTLADTYKPNGSAPWSPIMVPASIDLALSETLWDPASDPLPPYAPFGFSPLYAGTPAPTPLQLLAVSAVVAPPVPLDVRAGATPAVILTMEPSLIGVTPASTVPTYNGLSLMYGAITIDYDDGLPG